MKKKYWSILARVLFMIVVIVSPTCQLNRVDISYLDKHSGHPDEYGRTIIKVREVKFGDSELHNGADSGKTFKEKIETAKKLFAEHDLLEKAGLEETQGIRCLALYINRHVPGQASAKLSIWMTKPDRLAHSLDKLYVLRVKPSYSFREKLEMIEKIIEQERLLARLGMELNGISELKIELVK
jgi:hypothetical protein